MTTYHMERRARREAWDTSNELNEFHRRAVKSQMPDYQARWDREVGIMERNGLIGAITELQQLVCALRDAGHRLQAVGSATSSLVLHAIGLSSLCPIAYGFHLERFIDPQGTGMEELHVTCLASMIHPDILGFLSREGYATRVVQHETQFDHEVQIWVHIEAKHDVDQRSGCRLILQLVTSSDVAIANLLLPEQLEGCLQDSSTWELLERGATEGIPRLDHAAAREMLRNRKPKSLEGLAAVIVSQHPGRENGDRCDYQEDLMSQLHQEVGMPLRDAYETIRMLAPNKPDRLDAAKQKLLEQAKRHGVDEESAVRIWQALQSKSRYAPCKSHIFSSAQLTFQTAYAKVHYPRESYNILRNMGFVAPNVTEVR